MLAAVVAGHLITDSSARWWCAGGMTSVAAGFAVMGSSAVGVEPAWPAWGMVVALLGLGMGTAITALSVICAEVADAGRCAAAFGSRLTVSQLGGVVGIAAMATARPLEAFLDGFHAVFGLMAVLSLGVGVAAAGCLRTAASATSPALISAATKGCAHSTGGHWNAATEPLVGGRSDVPDRHHRAADSR
ncbi:hypothetical protein [Nocardia sp. NPDC059691]|uniref:hypothetical protein n=1 Tax=Nocardia sp. NPDC059691 TaxID=3346908 RepID=UPI0036CB020B